MSNYLKELPKPFLDDIVTNNCIPFIGAGFSKNAMIPSGCQMPLWSDLGNRLSDLIPNHENISPLETISAFEYEFSRAKLIEVLTKELLIDEASPGKAHLSFCKLPFTVVCTTNIDFLLERGYEKVRRYCCPIIQEDGLSVSNYDNRVNLLKFHGDLHNPSNLIVTEDDYDTYIEKHPLYATYIANLLISKTALFIGYSLDDPDLRHLWRLISERLGRNRRPAYTILVNAKPHLVNRYERRGVKVINLPGKEYEYANILELLFNELNEHWIQKTIEYSIYKEENAHNELSLPPDSENRVCLFICPPDLYSFYNDHLIPIALKHGLVPITTYDILSPGDNIHAKVIALVSRSKIIVVDISKRFSMREVGSIITTFTREDKKVVVILEDNTKIPVDLLNYPYIMRTEAPDLDSIDEIKNKFENEIRSISDSLLHTLENEPKRLFEKKEYRAAVISAISLLETELHGLYANKNMTNEYRDKSQRNIYDYLNMLGYSNVKRHDSLKEWINIRNKLVHTKEKINARKAKEIVCGIYEILDEVKNERNY
jgi:uncharacterized protein YutE (UPF0331/DUF86 family)